MSDRSETTTQTALNLSPVLRAEYDNAPTNLGPWYRTIVPAYFGLFVWAPFFDSLWIGGFARYSLAWLIASAVVASLLSFGLLYYVPASWGYHTRQPLGILAASTFGTTGSEWLTGVLVAIAGIVWYAIAIDYAVDSTLLGLKSCGLLGEGSLSSWTLGPVVFKSPVYLGTALFWIYITGTAALWQLTGVVTALMRVYVPIALLLLTGVGLWLLPNIGWHRIDHAALIGSWPSLTSRPLGHTEVVSLFTGFFAMAGLLSVNWGVRAERRRDVFVGGMAGIVVAGSWTAIMSSVIVAGAVGKLNQETQRDFGMAYDTQSAAPRLPSVSQGLDWYSTGTHDPPGLSFRWAVYHGIGGAAGGTILILFGLAALAPACYATWIYGKTLSTRWPLLGQWGWTWAGGAVAFLLAATSCVSRLDLIFISMGIVFAPAIGAMTGDWLRQRGAWAGLRPGVNRAGIIAWAGGVGIGLALELRPVEAVAPGTPMLYGSLWWYSASICGFVASFVYYLLLVQLGREQPAVPIGRLENGQ